MAEAPRNQPSGYEEDFVNAVENDFQCMICHFPLKETVLTRCGHRFCSECLEEYFRRQGEQHQPLTCPADREGLDRDRDVFPDKPTRRKILSFAIKCPSEGCGWIGELRSKEVHMASCLFKLVPCTNENCHVTVRRKDFENHVTITCPWRILECDHCCKPQPECKMKDHFGQCSKFPVTCPNNCGVSFPREMTLNHTEHDCPLTIISCPYEQMGCKTKVQRRQVGSHFQSAVMVHLDLTCVKLNNTEVKLNDTQVKLYDTEVKLNDTKVQLNDTEVKLQNTQVKLIDVQETTRKLMEKVDKLQRRFEEKIRKDEGRSRIAEDKIVMMKDDSSLYSKMFVWKINNFSEILRQAKTGPIKKLDSSPFYNETYGYKLKLIIFPDGDGSGKNTHLSVFIVLMKGEYDSILPWPFKKKVTLTLIDQQEDSVKRENVNCCFTTDDSSKEYARPVSEENAGKGFPKFISHEKLYSRRYLVDDTLFLQVGVDKLPLFGP